MWFNLVSTRKLCIMNVAASKVSLGMHNMSASEASPCVRATADPRI